MRKEIIDGVNIGNVRNFSSNIDDAINTAKKNIIEQAKRYKNNTLSSQTGFVAEDVHIGSFNIDSAFKRSSLQAVKEKNGFHGDYKILNKNKVVAKGEFKHYNNAQQTENAMRGYQDRELIGPKDQIEDIKKIAKRKALKNKTTRPEVSKEHRQVQKNVKDSIKKEDVSSKPKTLKQQKKITKKAQKGHVDVSELLPDFKTTIKSSIKTGAIEGVKSGMVFGGITSIASNAKDVYDGKKNFKDAALDTTKEVAISTIDSAVKNAAGSAAKTASVYLAQKTANNAARRLLGSSAPTLIAMSSVDILKDTVECVNGNISKEELAKNSVKNVATSSGGWAGAEAGAMIGTMVGGHVGTVVGGVLGGIAGSLGISSLFD
jgi:hypothetical protein